MNDSKMGTPANGYTKARQSKPAAQRSVRDAVTKYGDLWRSLGAPAGFDKQPSDNWTQADGEAFTMDLMERGVVARVKF